MFVNLTWDHGQDDSRRRIDPVINGLRRRDRHGFGQNVPAGIGVAVVSRVIAAAHLDADAMAPAKQHARGPQLDRDLIGRTPLRVRIGPPQYAVRDVVRLAVRMHVEQFHGEIGVWRRSGDMQHRAHRPGRFQIALERFG